MSVQDWPQIVLLFSQNGRVCFLFLCVCGVCGVFFLGGSLGNRQQHVGCDPFGLLTLSVFYVGLIVIPMGRVTAVNVNISHYRADHNTCNSCLFVAVVWKCTRAVYPYSALALTELYQLYHVESVSYCPPPARLKHVQAYGFQPCGTSNITFSLFLSLSPAALET